MKDHGLWSPGRRERCSEDILCVYCAYTSCIRGKLYTSYFVSVRDQCSLRSTGLGSGTGPRTPLVRLQGGLASSSERLASSLSSGTA